MIQAVANKRTTDSDAGTVPKLLYSRRDAAYALSISTRSLDYLVANKQIATRKLGKKVMFSAGELSRFARADHRHLTADPGAAN